MQTISYSTLWLLTIAISLLLVYVIYLWAKQGQELERLHKSHNLLLEATHNLTHEMISQRLDKNKTYTPKEVERKLIKMGFKAYKNDKNYSYALRFYGVTVEILPDGSIVVLFSGSLTAIKNIDLLEEILKEIRLDELEIEL